MNIVAGFASDLLDVKSVDLVLELLIFLQIMFDIVVAKPAGEKLLALVTLDFTAAVIVGTIHTNLLLFYLEL